MTASADDNDNYFQSQYNNNQSIQSKQSKPVDQYINDSIALNRSGPEMPDFSDPHPSSGPIFSSTPRKNKSTLLNSPNITNPFLNHPKSGDLSDSGASLLEPPSSNYESSLSSRLDLDDMTLGTTSFPSSLKASDAEIDNKIIVPIKIRYPIPTSARVTALVDSGASSNFISHSLFQKLKLRKFAKAIQPIDVHSAFEERNQTRFIINLKYRIGNTPFSSTFFVIDKLSQDVILGIPFIKKFSKHINWDQSTVAGVETVKTTNILINAIQFRRLVKRNAQVGCFFIKLDKPDTTNSNLPFDSKDYKEVLTTEPPSELPPKRNVEHRIDIIPGNKPPARPYYRLSLEENKILVEEISKLLKAGFIRPSTSPYSAPVLFVKKKDGSYRMCIDYRGLNLITVKNRYPLPNIEDLLNNLRGAKYFSKLDLRSGYHQIRIRKEDVEKTGFSTKNGHWEFLVMPFGLTNAPATFQNFMNDIFRPFLDDFVNVYLDDILIFSKTRKEHIKHIKRVLDVLKANKLVANLKKCEFMKTELEFLGFKVNSKGIHVTDEKVSAITKFPKPTAVVEAQRFLGMMNYYRKFIQNFSSIASPIHDYINKKSPWTDIQDQAFIALKNKLIQAPILISPDPEYRYVLTTDASKIAVSAVLEQFDNKKLKGVVAFFSKKLQGAQCNYPIRELEFLAVVEALKHFRPLLLGQTFTLRTDHFSLTTLLSQTKTPRGRIYRWFDLLSEYNFTTEYINGKANQVADALSRRPFLQVSLLGVHPSIFVVESDTPTSPLTETDSSTQDTTQEKEVRIEPPTLTAAQLKSIKIKTRQDPDTSKIIDILWNVNHPKHDAYALHYRLIDYCLYFDVVTTDDHVYSRLYIPGNLPELRREIIFNHHVCGHNGAHRTYLSVSNSYYWPNMFKDIKRAVSQCPSCLQAKPSHERTAGLLNPLSIPEDRWSSVSMDFVTGLPTSDSFDMIMVVVDRLTKSAHFIPTNKTLTGGQCAQLFVKEVIRLHGVPKTIVSDRDTRFSDKFWIVMNLMFGTTNLQSTAFHPETDGQTERLNRILRRLMSTHAVDYGIDWSHYLPILEFYYNSTYQSTIKTTPFIADKGYAPRLPKLILPPRHRIVSNRAENLSEIIQAIRERTKVYMAEAQVQQAVQANRRRKPHNIKVGDYVMVLREVDLSKDETSKFAKSVNLYVGPYEVLQAIGNNAFEVDLNENDRSHRVINVSKLRKFEPTPEYPKLPPINETILRDQIHEITGIVATTSTGVLLQFQNVLPGLVREVSFEFFNDLPRDLRLRLTANKPRMIQQLLRQNKLIEIQTPKQAQALRRKRQNALARREPRFKPNPRARSRVVASRSKTNV